MVKAESKQTMESYCCIHRVIYLNDNGSNWKNIFFWKSLKPYYALCKRPQNLIKFSSISNEKIRQLFFQIKYNYSLLVAIKKHMFDVCKDYLRKIFVNFEDSEKTIVPWSKSNQNIEFSRENIHTRLVNKRMRNGFTFDYFHNTPLKKQPSYINPKFNLVLIK